MTGFCSSCGVFIHSPNQPLFAENLCYDCEMGLYAVKGGDEDVILTWHWNLMINC